MLGPDIFVFLNEQRRISSPSDLADLTISDLWLYNLHYFDDLNSVGAEQRTEWHRQYLNSWLDDNGPGTAVAWDPYPISRRVVNWIRRDLTSSFLSPRATSILALQLSWLEQRMEYHLLGNHLIANCKALIFGGLFFDGESANRWYAQGMSVLQKQFGVQLLSDGGHYERSPSYHAIVLEDILDLLQVHQCFARPAPDEWVGYAKRMLSWLEAMTHPDGEVAYFNDSVRGAAPLHAQLVHYARALGFSVGSSEESADLRESGYVRLQQPNAVSILDLAPVGPNPQPGHGHADTLSFELSVFGQRTIVNRGVSVYGTGELRGSERATKAHSTLSIDGENSSDVWAGFRVGRRARLTERRVVVTGSPDVVGAHDGYRFLGLTHRRTWRPVPDGLEVSDEVLGTGNHRFTLFFHLHPDVVCEVCGDDRVQLSFKKSRREIELRVEGPGRLSTALGYFCLGFGERKPSDVIKYEFVGEAPVSFKTSIFW